MGRRRQQILQCLRRADLLREVRAFKAWCIGLPRLVWLIIGAALIVRLAGIGYGLPLQFDPDEQIWINHAHRMAFNPRPNPGWYGAPASTLFYPLAVLFLIYGAIVSVISWVDTSFVPNLRDDAEAFYYIARAFTALTGTLLLLPLYAMSRRLGVRLGWSLLSLVVVAMTSVMLELSSITRMDMLQTLFILLTLLFVIIGLQEPSRRHFIVAGIWVGLATTSKYPGIVAATSIFAALCSLTLEGRLPWRTALRWLIGAGLATAVTAFLSAPFLFLQISKTLHNVLFEARDSQIGAMKDGTIDALFHYVSVAVPYYYTEIMTVVSSVALVYMMTRRHAWIVSLFVVVYIVFLSLLSLRSDRWIVPLLPLLALAFGFGGSKLWDALCERGAQWSIVVRAILVMAMVAAVVPLLLSGAGQVEGTARNLDTRVSAHAWVKQNLPKGSRVLIETFAPQLSVDEFHTMIELRGDIVSWQDVSDRQRPPGAFGELARIGGRESPPERLLEAVEEAQVDYIIMSRFIDQYRHEAHHWPRELAALELLLSHYPEIARFKPHGRLRDPVIRILKVRQE